MNMARKYRKETGKEWPEPQMEITLCKECKFAAKIDTWLTSAQSVMDIDDPIPSGFCLSTDAPISDYVQGSRHCATINDKGHCKFFEGIKKERLQPLY